MPLDAPPDCTRLIAATSTMPAKPTPAWIEELGKRWDCERLQAYGWAPIESVARARRDVRRITLQDGRRGLRLPGVLIERARSGRVTLEVDAPGAPPVRTPLAPRIWAELATSEKESRSPPKPTAPPRSEFSSLTLTHCDSAILEVAHRGRAWRREASECETSDPGYAYAMRIASLAITYSPACEPARRSGPANQPPGSPLWRLARCGARFDPLMLPK